MAATAAGIRAGKAYVEIGTKDSELTKGLRAAREKVQAFGKSISEIGTTLAKAGAGIAAPLALAVKQFVDFGSQLDDMAKKTGFSVETLSELKFVADQSGSNLEDIDKAAKRMARTMLDAKDGMATAKDSLDALGLSAGELFAMSPEDQFFAIATALSEVDDATTKAALAQEIFGRSGTNLLPMLAEGKDGIVALREEAKRLGVTMSKEDAAAAEELGDAFGSLSAAAMSAFRQVGAALAPALKSIAEDLTEIVPKVRDFIRDNGEWVVTLAKVAAGLLGVGVAMKGLGATIALVTATNPWILLAAAIGTVAAQIAIASNNTKTWRERMGDVVATWLPELLPKNIPTDRDPDKRRQENERVDAEIAALFDALDGTVESYEELIAALEANTDGFNFHTEEMAESLAAAKRLRAALDAEEQQRFDAMEQEARILDIQRDGADAMIETLKEQIAAAEAMADAGSRRPGLAIAGSAEFVRALQEHFAPRQDKQLTLLQKQLDEEKKARIALDKVVEQGRNAQQLKIVD
ncbi:MAG: phage tail tape measure protein [Planctomycetota bacterium]|nr:MAG: phage tail tape measure protein [Planctomycetota bacterium]